MFALRRTAVVSIALLGAVGFDLANPATDPIVGSWLGPYVGIVDQIANGVESVYAASLPNLPLVMNGGNAAVFNTDFSGSWHKQAGEYHAKLDSGFAAQEQTQLPLATIHKKKYRLLHLVRNIDTLLGDVSINTYVTDGGDSLKDKESGTFAMTRQ